MSVTLPLPPALTIELRWPVHLNFDTYLIYLNASNSSLPIVFFSNQYTLGETKKNYILLSFILYQWRWSTDFMSDWNTAEILTGFFLQWYAVVAPEVKKTSRSSVHPLQMFMVGSGIFIQLTGALLQACTEPTSEHLDCAIETTYIAASCPWRGVVWHFSQWL